MPSPQSNESISKITVNIQGIELDYVCVAKRTTIQNNKQPFPSKNLVLQALAQSVQNQMIDQVLNQTPPQNQTTNHHQPVFTQNQAFIDPIQNEFPVQNNLLVDNQNPVQNLVASMPNHDVMNEQYDVTNEDYEIIQRLGLQDDRSAVENQPLTRHDPMLSSSGLCFQEPQRQIVQDVPAGVPPADQVMADSDWEDVNDFFLSEGFSQNDIESDGPGADDRRRRIRSKLWSKPVPVAKSEILEAEDEIKPSNFWTKVSWWGAAVLFGGVLLERFYF